jgi:hypothetical protein
MKKLIFVFLLINLIISCDGKTKRNEQIEPQNKTSTYYGNDSIKYEGVKKFDSIFAKEYLINPDSTIKQYKYLLENNLDSLLVKRFNRAFECVASCKRQPARCYL